jgi:hypothetical protein
MSAEPAVTRRPSPGGAAEVASLRRRLAPGVNRKEIAAGFDELFRAATVPDPAPRGFLPGALVMTTTFPALDAYVRGVTRLWMPWMGKAFDPQASTGVNRLTPSARLPMRSVWPSYRFAPVTDGRLDAFPFRTRVEPGAVDPKTNVLVIDYDFEANPGFIIRRIRDELVQVDDGFYLGKILFKWRGGFRRIGFFTLRNP